MIAAIYIDNSISSGLLDAARSEVYERVAQLQHYLDCEVILGNTLKYLQLAKGEPEIRAKALQLKRVCQSLTELYPNGDLDDFLNDFLYKSLPTCAAEDPPQSLDVYCNCEDCEAGPTQRRWRAECRGEKQGRVNDAPTRRMFRIRCWVPKYQKWMDVKDTKCKKLIKRGRLPGSPTIVEQPESHPFVYDVECDKWRDFYEQFQHHYLGTEAQNENLPGPIESGDGGEWTETLRRILRKQQSSDPAPIQFDASGNWKETLRQVLGRHQGCTVLNNAGEQLKKVGQLQLEEDLPSDEFPLQIS
ncbi:unnamed protein product, partial [Symbiodinium sp. CCMP2456]